MAKTTLTYDGWSHSLSFESIKPIIITSYDERGNVIKSHECVDDESLRIGGLIRISIPDKKGNMFDAFEIVDGKIISLEGSLTNSHFEQYENWDFNIPPNVEIRIRKSNKYLRTAKNLNLYDKELLRYETPVLQHIIDKLRNKKCHKAIHEVGNVRLSECDFGGRDYGRLVYWADKKTVCIYLGLVFKRDDKSFHHGGVSKEYAKEIAQSILDTQAEVIREDEENARRNNRGQ